jgi:GNAT superfamily N-acetyltransferase
MFIEQIPKERHDQIRSVYESVEYKGGINDEDIGFLATMEGKPVGAVRLCIENSVLVLRGMMIHPDYQHQGIGRALLKALDPIIGNRQCYCINPPHLKDFYGSIGIEVVEIEKAPLFLFERLEKYNSDDHDYIIMMRHKS